MTRIPDTITLVIVIPPKIIAMASHASAAQWSMLTLYERAKTDTIKHARTHKVVIIIVLISLFIFIILVCSLVVCGCSGFWWVKPVE